jgi:uncharacterized protein
VIGIPCKPIWRTPAGLALAGPQHWGYTVDYVPIEDGLSASKAGAGAA